MFYYNNIVNSVIEEIYRTGLVHDESGNEYELHSGLDREEGEFIYQLIHSNPDIRKTLEVGCAYGLSSLYICSALSERTSAKHIIVDPDQNQDWHGVGISNLKRAGCNFFELIEKPSEYILPEIALKEPGTFDLILIDGWHTFDHTLLDLFYANRLLRIGGYIIIDDCRWSSIAKAVSYVSKYPAYRLEKQSQPRKTFKRKAANIIKVLIPPGVAGYIIPRNLYDRYYIPTIYSTMVALKKVKSDERNYDWFKPF